MGGWVVWPALHRAPNPPPLRGVGKPWPARGPHRSCTALLSPGSAKARGTRGRNQKRMKAKGGARTKGKKKKRGKQEGANSRETEHQGQSEQGQTRRTQPGGGRGVRGGGGGFTPYTKGGGFRCGAIRRRKLQRPLVSSWTIGCVKLWQTQILTNTNSSEVTEQEQSPGSLSMRKAAPAPRRMRTGQEAPRIEQKKVRGETEKRNCPLANPPPTPV